MRNVFIIFLFAFLSSCSSKQKHVGIQTLGNFDSELVQSIQKSIYNIYGFKVSILPQQKLPEYAFVNIKSPRYRADKIIKMLKQEKSDSIDFVLGLIEKDISTTKRDANGETLTPAYKYEDWGIFGLGYRPGNSCVVSSFRIKNVKRDLLIDRIQKISVHEIGHNLGLKHCKSKSCVMRDAAESIKTIDNVHLTLCKKCSLQIKTKNWF